MNAASRPELQALYQVRQASKRRQSICGGYARYERLKAEWSVSNPDATPAQYDHAMGWLARDCGV